MKVFDYMEKYGHEQVIFFYDKTTNLKGITAIMTLLWVRLGNKAFQLSKRRRCFI